MPAQPPSAATKTPAPGKAPTAPGKAPVGKPGLGLKSKGGGGPQCVDFPFDANSKPITGQMLELEQKKLKSLFGKKPKVPISQIASLIENKTSVKELDLPLKECQLYYKRMDKDPEHYLEVLARKLLEGASKEKTDHGYQRYLLYQTLDTLSMAVQHSSKRVNLSAQSLIVAVFKITGGTSSGYMIEKEILKEMTVMTNQKKDLNDLESRNRMINLCMQGRRYYEAFYQLIEFENIMQLKSRSMYVLKAGEIQFRKALIFQHIVDFYSKVASGQKEKEQVKDMGKLRSFIFRFNLDNRSLQLQPLVGTGPLPLNKTVASFLNIANHYYTQAGNNERFPHRHKAYLCKARNHMLGDKAKPAMECLQEGLVALSKANLKAIEKGNEKINMLEYFIEISKDHGAPRKTEAMLKELAELRNQVRGMEGKKRDETRKKEDDPKSPEKKS
ncbi:MAG: hypothetical protein HQM12_04825 [SAR324 cluster bacterium]|nr:hypothetical protein [SAR324 cluster bacterium]